MTSSTTYRWIIKIIIMTFRWILLARDYPRARADVNCFGARASVQCKYKVLMFYPDAWRTPILTCLHMSLILRNARAHQPANFFSLKLIFFFCWHFARARFTRFHAVYWNFRHVPRDRASQRDFCAVQRGVTLWGCQIVLEPHHVIRYVWLKRIKENRFWV